ncbi:MAG: RNA 2',3'-cyclic phosphodiesterase [Candidatus Komeilibacteria bacterium]
MKKARIFLSIAIPDDIKQALAQQLRSLHHNINNAIWLDQKNWHITLAFLGEVATDTVAILAKKIPVWVKNWQPAHLQLSEISAFPNPYKAKIIIINSQPDKELIRLQNSLLAQLQDQQISFDAKALHWQPHLTIGRLHKPQNLAEHIFALNDKVRRPWRVSQLQCFSSILEKSGSKYYLQFNADL